MTQSEAHERLMDIFDAISRNLLEDLNRTPTNYRVLADEMETLIKLYECALK